MATLDKEVEVAIVGGGPAGLVLALSLHQIGVSCRVYEAAPEIKPVGVGINLLPHAVRELDELDLVPALDEVGIRTRDASYFNRFGQHIITEPAGEAAGYPWPQFSIHRGYMQQVFLDAVRARLGEDSVVVGHRCVRVDTADDHVDVHFVDPENNPLPSVRASLVVGADGIKSALREQFYPDQGPPVYSGLTIWRGATTFPPFLSGANTVRIGWMSVGKLMAYPIAENVDGKGNQLVNFVATLERPHPENYDWHAEASLDDFFPAYADWTFDWLDVPALLRSTEKYLVYPMVDRDPVDTWTFGRATLMGDAAHPMYPRGSNGAGQAILDARYLTASIKRNGVTVAALQDYDRVRVEQTAKVVRMNRTDPPDAILREVHERSGDKPFDKLSDIISEAELRAFSERYRKVAGFAAEELRSRPSLVGP